MSEDEPVEKLLRSARKAKYCKREEAVIKKRQPPLHWIVRGYESTTKIFEQEETLGVFNERRMVELLRALAATALTYGEILGGIC